jgi:branched-chain amino acid transport system permease protein
MNTTFYKVTIFMASAFFAGIAGAFLAYSLGAIAAADVETNLGLKIISVCIVGGIGTISGSFGGAYFLMALLWSMNEISRLLSDITGIYSIMGVYKIFEDIFYYGAIVLVLLFMPHGIIHTIVEKFNKRYQKKKSTQSW